MGRIERVEPLTVSCQSQRNIRRSSRACPAPWILGVFQLGPLTLVLLSTREWARWLGLALRPQGLGSSWQLTKSSARKLKQLPLTAPNSSMLGAGERLHHQADADRRRARARGGAAGCGVAGHGEPGEAADPNPCEAAASLTPTLTADPNPCEAAASLTPLGPNPTLSQVRQLHHDLARLLERLRLKPASLTDVFRCRDLVKEIPEKLAAAKPQLAQVRVCLPTHSQGTCE